jgi:hypothetical protein
VFWKGEKKFSFVEEKLLGISAGKWAGNWRE